MSRRIGGSAMALFALACLLALAGPAGAQQRSKLAGLNRSLELGVVSSSVSNPLVREPGSDGGGPELPVNQSRRTLGARAGTIFAAEKVALELGFTYWTLKLDDFTYSGGVFQGTQVSYSDVGMSYGFVDVGLHYAPWPKVPASAYGLFGMGGKSRSYDVAGAAFPFEQWNGHQGATEFVYSYGVGVRLFPERHISVLADFRWIPGDLISDASGECWQYYSNGSSWDSCSGHPANRTHVLSLGAMIGFPFRSR